MLIFSKNKLNGYNTRFNFFYYLTIIDISFVYVKKKKVVANCMPIKLTIVSVYCLVFRSFILRQKWLYCLILVSQNINETSDKRKKEPLHDIRL